MVVRSGNVVIGSRSGAVIFEKNGGDPLLNSPAKPAVVLGGLLNTMGGLAMWGQDNLLPQKMMEDIEKTSVLQATISAKARIAIGSGPMPARVVGIDANGSETLEFIQDEEIQDFLDQNDAFAYSLATATDLFGLGNPFTQILLNANRDKIVAFRRHDPCECRYSKRDPNTLKSENVLLSGDWRQFMNLGGDQQANFANKHIATVPLLDRSYPLYDLQSRTSGHTFFMGLGYPLSGRQYYGPSVWYSAKQWVDIAQGIPEMKAAMFNNQLSIKYIVEIHPEFWALYDPTYDDATSDKQKEIREQYYTEVDELLVGGKNAYKSIMSTKVTDRQTMQVVSAVTITAVDDKIKDGKLLTDNAGANSEILFALSMNPALVGVDTPGQGGAVQSAGSGSNIREAYLVQLMQLEAERRINSTVFNVAKWYNGWDKRTVLRFPNKILTTLNQGGNTKPVA